MSTTTPAENAAARPIGARPTDAARSEHGGPEHGGAGKAVLDRLKALVRRHPQLMQFYRGLDVPLARGRMSIDRGRMDGVVAANRAALAGFGPWIDAEAMRRSQFSYGLSPDWAAALTHDIGTIVTYSDLLCYAASQSTTGTSYLEIGVSVGKNFWQLLNQVSGGELVGMDIEEINPPLRAKLVPVVMANSAGAPRLDRFSYAPQANDVCYCTGDVFDPGLWDKLRGRRFNLVFSDAFHDPAAVMYEWRRVVELDLLDHAGFTVVWDDLVSRPIRRVFNDIIADCVDRYGLKPSQACLMHVAGWVGEFEPAHPIGIISTQGFVV